MIVIKGGGTILHAASSKNEAEIVELFLRRGATLNAQDAVNLSISLRWSCYIDLLSMDIQRKGRHL